MYSLKEVIDAIQSSNQEGLNALSELKSGSKDYLDELDEIDDKYKNLKKTWEDLNSERERLLSGEDAEADKLKSDADERIRALEEERDAVIGNFDFSETQNVRSQRFAKARDIEKNILEEINTLSEALAELEAKRQARLEEIRIEIEDFISEYGTLIGLDKA